MFEEEEDREIEGKQEELEKLYQKSPLLKLMRENKSETYGFRETTIQRNIEIAERLIFYALKKTEEKVAVAKTVVIFGTATETPVERVLSCLIEVGDVKREGDKIVYARS